MYEIFERLCAINNVTPYKVGKATGIATSTLSDWKSGKSRPKQDKLKKIADYFNVSVDYLMTGEEKTDVPMFDAEQIELITLYAKLKKEQKETVLNLLRSFAQ